jgi:uncharacterized membrane protein YedE/YeeE
MNLPLMDSGMITGLICGIGFGYVLQRAGFSSPCRLTAQLRLNDWTVFKVMFSAILVAAGGLSLLEWTGIIDSAELYTPTTYLWAVLAGGALVGLGFAVGGYCPGTSMVALFSGKLDALAFLGGLIAGTWMFAGVYTSLEQFLVAGEGPEAQTLPQLLGLPTWVVMLALIVVAIGGWIVGSRIERHQPANP